jgi:hypothetical protein
MSDTISYTSSGLAAIVVSRLSVVSHHLPWAIGASFVPVCVTVVMSKG